MTTTIHQDCGCVVTLTGGASVIDDSRCQFQPQRGAFYELLLASRNRAALDLTDDPPSPINHQPLPDA